MKVNTGNLFSKLLILVIFLIITAPIFGQSAPSATGKCFTEEEAKKTVDLIKTSQNVTENKELRAELLKMRTARQEIEQKVIDNPDKRAALIPAADEMGAKDLLRLCEAVKQNGWMRKEIVGEDGADAALYLVKSNKEIGLQREIFPIVVAAAEKGYVAKSQLTGLIDSIRVGTGLPQIFGTQTYIKNEMMYLYPLLDEAKVDEWRKQYDLAPLSFFIKYLQSRYRTGVLKSPSLPVPPQLKENKKTAQTTNTTSTAANLLNSNNAEDEVVKVESNLVNLNVRVYQNDFANADVNLQKDDFQIFENGKQQDVEFFSTTDAPFDLVLLLDLSGSTAGKQDLIRKSTQRFIEASRPADRIAIVTFTNTPKVISDLTQDRGQLLASIKKIKDTGGSGVWGAVQFAFDNIIKKQSKGRRSAILIMTDGVDTSFFQSAVDVLPPEYPTFTDLLETVRSNETTVLPIYLDTEKEASNWDRKAYPAARRTLSMLAEESGGQMYMARKVEDLDGVYEKVINDLGKVYSIGYQPAETTRDGGWRILDVKVPKYPNLKVLSKQGYYAK